MSNKMALEANRRNLRVALACLVVVASMAGAAFASVPLYRMFCQITGFAGTTQRATKPPDVVLERSITVRFDANTASSLPWRFEPVQQTLEVKLGEPALALYRATNMSDHAITGSATYNVAPEQAGIYFNKLQCFCFTEQRLAAGQTAEMPVSFFVDPALVGDKDANGVTQITLSYTFYPVAKPASVEAGDGAARKGS
jgi:cytochrome c oxidase assembly protein subunit 11